MKTIDVMDAIRERRALRSFTEEDPGEAEIRKLLDAAVMAPSAMHLEPWGFVVIQDRARLKAYSERAKSMLRSRSEELAVGWGSIAHPHGDHRAMLQDPKFNIFYDAGCLVVICRTIESPFAEADCWLAAQNFMLAAHASGLGTCCIGFAVPVLNLPEVKHELGIPAAGAAVAPIILGYPRGLPGKVARNPPQVLRWVR